MTQELGLIAARRSDVMGMIGKYRATIAELEAELADLETAGRVLARLSGAKWPAPSADNGAGAPTSGGAQTAVSTLTMPEMILAVLSEAYRQGLRDLSPKEIQDRMTERFGFQHRGDNFASIVWRVWKQDRIERVGEGRYRALQKEKASDLLSQEDQSEASNQPGAQGGEARPGGGT